MKAAPQLSVAHKWPPPVCLMSTVAPVGGNENSQASLEVALAAVGHDDTGSSLR